MEVAPAGYAALAANEAEKAADINILEVRAFGSFGRIYLGGEERDIDVAYRAAEAGDRRPSPAARRAASSPVIGETERSNATDRGQRRAEERKRHD